MKDYVIKHEKGYWIYRTFKKDQEIAFLVMEFNVFLDSDISMNLISLYSARATFSKYDFSARYIRTIDNL